MALNAVFTSQVATVHTGSTDLSALVDTLDSSHRITLASGTGAGQADIVWHDRRTLAASATEDLDLAGVLVSAFGATLTFARLKAIKVYAASANTNNVNVTRPASNGVPIFLAAGDGLPVKPGGVFEWCAPDATGIAVTASTGDLLTFTNSAGTTSVTYDVVLIGASA